MQGNRHSRTRMDSETTCEDYFLWRRRQIAHEERVKVRQELEGERQLIHQTYLQKFEEKLQCEKIKWQKQQMEREQQLFHDHQIRYEQERKEKERSKTMNVVLRDLKENAEIRMRNMIQDINKMQQKLNEQQQSWRDADAQDEEWIQELEQWQFQGEQITQEVEAEIQEIEHFFQCAQHSTSKFGDIQCNKENFNNTQQHS